MEKVETIDNVNALDVLKNEMSKFTSVTDESFRVEFLVVLLVFLDTI